MIGLFLGDTDFSEIVLKKIKIQKIKYFIIDFSKKNKFKRDNHSFRISIGKFGTIIDLIKQKKCKKVLFAGKIAKPNFSSLRLDFKGMYYMPRIIKASKLGDAAILKELINQKSQNSDLYSVELTKELFRLETEFKEKKAELASLKKKKEQINNRKKTNKYHLCICYICISNCISVERKHLWLSRHTRPTDI